MSIEQVRNIYKQISELGIIYVNISGGEPILNKDFFQIIEFAAKQPYNTCLLTNGTLWDNNLINRLSEADPERAIMIQFSLDGKYEIMKEQRLVTRTEFDNILESINSFKSLGFTVGCLHVVNSLTVEKSLDTIKYLLSEIQVDVVQVVPLFPSGRAANNRVILDKFWDQWSELIVEVTKIKKLSLWGERSNRFNIGFFTLFELVLPLDKAGMHDDIFNVWELDVSSKKGFWENTHRDFFCEGGRSELAISANLELFPCVASLRTEFIAGELLKNSLNELWLNSEMLHWFRNSLNKVILKEPCSSCSYKDICGGGCRISALEIAGDRYSPDPRCPIVREVLDNGKL
jgi:radical SAM protein with 4Fe4S-binding SPASM domain